MPQHVYVASDGTGRTCEQLVRSALVQFDEQAVRINLRPNVRTTAEVEQIVEEASKHEGIILFTFVSQDARKAMKDTAAERFVEAVDVLGPVLWGLNSIIHRPPAAKPGLYYKSERGHFDRMDAIDYTLKHDDGQRLDGLGRADIVLVGVSRTSKSSTCFFLAYRGIRAANVPLLPGVEPPAALTRLAKERVVGLSVNCQRLQAIRATRLDTLGSRKVGDYIDRSLITAELHEARDTMKRYGWREIDASYMAIEEIAKHVIRLMDEARLRRRSRQPRTVAR